MKELTKTYSVLLQDKRVKSEQAKYEAFTRQRNSVLTKYKKVFQAFNDLVQGLMSAQSFYSEMKQTAESLEKNIEQYVNNRRTEGANLLNGIEQDKASGAGSQADRERDRLRELMERMSVDPSSSSTKSSLPRPSPSSRLSQSKDLYSSRSPVTSPSLYPKKASNQGNGNLTMKSPMSTASYQGLAQYTPDVNQHNPIIRDTLPSSSDLYNPMVYPYQSPASPPPSQPAQPAQPAQSNSQYPLQQNQYLPPGYVPPPPPPGPPPSSQGNFGNPNHPHPSGAGGYAHHLPRQSSITQQPADPWSELNAWK